MHLKKSVLFILSLATISLLTEAQFGHAQSSPPSCCKASDTQCRRSYPRKPLCSVPRHPCSGATCPVPNRSSTGNPWIPTELLVQIGTLIEKGQATVGDHLLLGYANAIEGNFTASESRYSQALELAKQIGDVEGQAAARNGLGLVYATVGKPREASIELLMSRDMYQKLGNQQRLDQLQLQLQDLNLQKLRIQPQLRDQLRLIVPSN